MSMKTTEKEPIDLSEMDVDELKRLHPDLADFGKAAYIRAIIYMEQEYPRELFGVCVSEYAWQRYSGCGAEFIKKLRKRGWVQWSPDQHNALPEVLIEAAIVLLHEAISKQTGRRMNPDDALGLRLTRSFASIKVPNAERQF